MNDQTNCPNCKEGFKTGFLKSVYWLSNEQTAIINELRTDKKEGYCNKCGNDLYSTSVNNIRTEIKKIQKNQVDLIKSFPVVSAHAPHKWDYDILDMVTGQSTTGTGVLTEITSSFTDIVGASSTRHNTKLKHGEELCFAQLRMGALEMGGNAVIGTDIDYSEIGSGKGILMVCMAGTAVRLKNTDILGEKRKEDMLTFIEIQKMLERLLKHNISMI